MAIAQDVIKRFEQVQHIRQNWEPHWQEIAERVLPRYSNTFMATQSQRERGEKRTEKMFDATAALGLERFAAAMESMLTPRNSRWHRLRASDDSLNRARRVQLWFDEVTALLFKYRYRPAANYASNQHENYMGLGAFGTAVMFVDELAEGGIRYRSTPLGEAYALENHQGVIDTVFRQFEYTARQIVQRWPDVEGKDEFEKVNKELEKNPDRPFEIIHCVKPRADVDPTRRDFRGMPFVSYYVMREGQAMLSEGGYNTFPYATSRYVTAPGEIYGRSPAMLVLPNIKVINEQKKTMLKQGHRATDPVLLGHDDGILDNASLRPGSYIAGGVSADGRPLVHTLPTGNIAAGEKMMEQERAVINDAFLVTLFQILIETPQMTATEVLERAREKGALLSPTMGRQQSEALGPQIEREIDILSRQGLLPEMPPELLEAEGEFEIEYDSPLSRAQKAEEASGLFRYMEWATAYATATGDPSPFDHIDVDEAGPALMEINAIPAKWQRAAQDVEALRQQRSQQAAAEQAVAAAPAAAAVLKATGANA